MYSNCIQLTFLDVTAHAMREWHRLYHILESVSSQTVACVALDMGARASRVPAKVWPDDDDDDKQTDSKKKKQHISWTSCGADVLLEAAIANVEHLRRVKMAQRQRYQGGNAKSA